MACGKTVLIHKDLSRGTIPSNYIISDKMYESLDERGVSTEEQKGCKKGARGTNDFIFIDKMLLMHAKKEEKTQLCVGWTVIKHTIWYRILESWNVLPCSK